MQKKQETKTVTGKLAWLTSGFLFPYFHHGSVGYARRDKCHLKPVHYDDI